MTENEFKDLMLEIKQSVTAKNGSRVSAECMNTLHAATPGHPWAAGKSVKDMARVAIFALAGRNCPARLRMKLERVAA